MDKRSQGKAILDHMRTGNAITALDAFNLTGTLHFPRRIKDIKDGIITGEPIDLGFVWVKRNGKKFKSWFCREIA